MRCSSTGKLMRSGTVATQSCVWCSYEVLEKVTVTLSGVNACAADCRPGALGESYTYALNTNLNQAYVLLQDPSFACRWRKSIPNSLLRQEFSDANCETLKREWFLNLTIIVSIDSFHRVSVAIGGGYPDTSCFSGRKVRDSECVNVVGVPNDLTDCSGLEVAYGGLATVVDGG